jgi:hypoxanthine phosphoribosyltransferase
MKSYDYAHRTGVRQLTWDDFAGLADRLAELLEPIQPQLILGIARAGLFPATLVASTLRRELFPIRLTRRLNDQVLYDQPVWKVPIPLDVTGKVIAIIDEIADTGQTLAIAAQSALGFGALQVVTASLISHSWAEPAPQICSLVTDEFVIFPWNQHVLEGGNWIPNPEVIAGLKAQGQGSPG